VLSGSATGFEYLRRLCSHRRQHVHLAFVDERLCVVVARFLRADVAKVNVVDAVFAPEVADDFYNILADLRGHARIQSNAVRGTRDEVDQPLPMPIGVDDMAVGAEPELVWLFMGLAVMAMVLIIRRRRNALPGIGLLTE